MSADSAMHAPAPTAAPLIAAITGTWDIAHAQPRPVERHHLGSQFVNRGIWISTDPACVAAGTESGTGTGNDNGPDRRVDLESAAASRPHAAVIGPDIALRRSG